MVVNSIDKKIVLSFADCDMRVSGVAKKFYMHPNSIQYHLDKVYKITGLNPRCFYDLIKLVDRFKKFGS